MASAKQYAAEAFFLEVEGKEPILEITRTI